MFEELSMKEQFEVFGRDARLGVETSMREVQGKVMRGVVRAFAGACIFGAAVAAGAAVGFGTTSAVIRGYRRAR